MVVMSSNFSVCLSVYKNDRPQEFEKAVMSIYNQTWPKEIVLVVDGSIPSDLDNTISVMKQKIGIMNVVRLQVNQGHAIAPQTGIKAAKNDLCAIMDADDIAVPTRFEDELEVLSSHQRLAL